jgi:hypothetical protein
MAFIRSSGSLTRYHRPKNAGFPERLSAGNPVSTHAGFGNCEVLKATPENPFRRISLLNFAVPRQTSSQGTKPCIKGFPCPTKFSFEIRSK